MNIRFWFVATFMTLLLRSLHVTADESPRKVPLNKEARRVFRTRYASMMPAPMELARRSKKGPSKTAFPSIQFAPIYRVLLHHTIGWGSPKTVAQKVQAAVPFLTIDEAFRITEQANVHGTAIVVTAPIEEAVTYEATLRQMGLRSSLEMA